ncbi:MAG: NAD(P)-binding domain-containing protein, partial [Phycisphaerales bacterium]|nr:NAD(P)-binding domain-containing protein [Phycisphaerales bacterium]
MNRHETIIIGGGPIGLEIAASLQIAGNDCIVLDSGAIGSTIDRLFPPNTRFFSSPERLEIAGVACSTVEQEKITREEYLCYLRQVVDTVGIDIRTFHHVETIHRSDDGFDLEARTRSGACRRFRTDRLVLATGGMARVRTLGIDGESLPHVRYELGDPHQY